MKKSEAINIIQERIRDYYDDGDEERQRNLADHILDDMLKIIGMLPPPTQFEFAGKTICDVGWDNEDA